MKNKLIANFIYKATDLTYKLLRTFISQEKLEQWKPVHLCWWFIKNRLPVPNYFIAGAVFTPSEDEYRFAEDGTIGSETLLGTQSTSFGRTITADNLIWLRVQIQENGGKAGGVGDDWQLQVQKGALVPPELPEVPG